MSRKGTWITAALVLLAGGGIGWNAQAKSTPSGSWNAVWQLDAARSDTLGRFGRHGDHRGGQGGAGFEGRRPEGRGPGPEAGRGKDGGRWEKDGNRPDGAGHEGPGGRRFGRRGGRGGMLPERLSTERVGTTLRFKDEQGNVLQEIVTGTVNTSATQAGRPRTMQGSWKGDVLQIEHQGDRGSMTQTFELEDGGRTLVVHVKRPAHDGEPARDFRRVYRRIGS